MGLSAVNRLALERNAPVRAVGLLLCLGTACSGLGDFPRLSLEESATGIAFVDDRECGSCHQTEYEAWTRSHHDQAMQPARDETVLADFRDATFTHFGVTTRFYRRDGRFYVDAEGPAGVMQEYEVLYTFGVEPLQQYLLGFPGGRLQALTIAWDTEESQWFDLYPDERILPGDPLHWTGRLQRWNDRCAECHSTDLRVAYDPESDVYRTTWAAIDVGCQACHGPGAGHIAWADSAGTTLASAGSPGDGRGLVVDPGGRTPAAQLSVCARCHSLRSRASAEDDLSNEFDDDFTLALLREETYHADGQILGEVYVVGSFVQSRMQRHGVACTDCHDPHTAGLLIDGNQLCTRCHQQDPPPGFPTLQSKEYDSPLHHHHEAGSAGAACVECHMPAQTYMVVDPRRDHSLRVPRPDLATDLGSPDACTMCHADRTTQWAADAIAEWYSTPARPAHFGEAIAAGRRLDPDATGLLAQLAADTSQPGIARATALELLGGYRSREAIVAAVSALGDADPAVRLAALNALEQVPPTGRVPIMAPLLSDPVASIRAAAARMLAPAAAQLTDAGQAAALQRGLTAYRQTQLAQSDQPESYHNLGNLYASQGQTQLAEQSYAAALGLDSTFVPARVNLAMLLNQIGRNAEAERNLRQAISLAPDLGELHYSLGLLLAEQQRIAEAITELTLAAGALPGRARVHYNLGLALQQIGRTDDAEAALLHAHQTAPQDPDFVNGLTFFYRQNSRWPEAVRFARMLVGLLPDEEGPQRLLDQILAEGGR